MVEVAVEVAVKLGAVCTPYDVSAPFTRPLPATDSVAPGVVVPIPTDPPAVAKYADPDDVMAVVEAYPTVRVVPLYVRDDESIKPPPVVANGTRPDVSEEMERYVDDAYGNTEAVVDVAIIDPTVRVVDVEVILVPSNHSSEDGMYDDDPVPP